MGILKVSFDLDGTLFGIHSKRLVRTYNKCLEMGCTVGILTGRGINNPRKIIQAEVRRLGISHWDFWYDASHLTDEERNDIHDITGKTGSTLNPGVIRFKKRMLMTTGIDMHFDDECKMLWKEAPELGEPLKGVVLIDVTRWGGDSYPHAPNLPSIRV